MWFGFCDKTSCIFLVLTLLGCVFTRTILTTIDDKNDKLLRSNRITSEHERIHTTSLSPPFNVGVFIFPF